MTTPHRPARLALPALSAALSVTLMGVTARAQPNATPPPTQAPAATDAPEATQATWLPNIRATAKAPPTPQRQTQVLSSTDSADDAAERLQGVNGVRLLRQAGTSSAISLRGLTGPRVPIVLDGMDIEGACNHGMDPATSYLALDSIDRLSVLKGPHTVQYGGLIGGAVLAERTTPATSAPSRGELQGLNGAFGERLLAAEGLYNTEAAWLRVNAQQSQRGDYLDGQGHPVPSAYERQQFNLDAGWRLSPQQTLQFDLGHSDGNALYPAFHMDGTLFQQDRAALSWKLRHALPWLDKLELKGQVQRVHHLMDNFTLRGPAGAVVDEENTLWEVMRQDTLNRLLRLQGDVSLTDQQRLTLGLAWRRSDHDAANHLRSQTCIDVGLAAPVCQSRDPGFRPYYQVQQSQSSAFGEWVMDLDAWRLVAGQRWDRVSTDTGAVRDFTTGLTPKSSEQGHATALLQQRVARVEWMASPAWQWHLAWGQSERAPGPIEIGSVDALSLRPERNHELNAGLHAQQGHWEADVSAFESHIQDFILLTSGTAARNVDALRRGWEAELSQRVTPQWQWRLALNTVRGQNTSMQSALAQTPADEVRATLAWTSGPWQIDGEWRGVARQDRYAFGQGNTNGLDLNQATPGFGVLKLQTRYQFKPGVSLSVGIDNVANKAYAEHINHSSDRSWAGLGKPLSDRVPEPGRRWWIKWTLAL